MVDYFTKFSRWTKKKIKETKDTIDYAKEIELELKKFYIGAAYLGAICKFARKKGYKQIGEHNIEELYKEIIDKSNKFSMAYKSLSGSKDEVRIKRFLYYQYYIDIGNQLIKEGHTKYIDFDVSTKERKVFSIHEEINDFTRMLSNANKY